MQPLVVPALPARRDMIGSTALQMASSEEEARNLEAARTEEIYKLAGIALQMASPAARNLEAARTEEMYKLIDELAWEGADVAEAKKLLDSCISSTDQLSIGETAIAAQLSIGETAIAATARRAITPCTRALTSLTIDTIGLVMSLVGLPSKIGKKAAKAIATEAGEALMDEVKTISVQYFSDAGNLPNVANGVWAFLKALRKSISIPNIISTIFGTMSWGETFVWTAVIGAQVVLLFATNVAGIVVKLAMVTPDIVSVVASTVTVVNDCD